MEQTLGKRIVSNRKRIGLTQDQLAEQLGVTAQAVSKWENDQSCPDISTLPKLADIFGITTDELLGREDPIPARTAEVVCDEEENEDDGVHIQSGKWELKWEGGKKESLTFALLVLLVGGLTLLSMLQDWDASFWSILWPSALLVYGIRWLFSKFSFFSLGCTLCGSYFLISNLNIWQFNLKGELVWPTIVILFGLSLLVDALRKPKKPRFRVNHNGVHVDKTENNFSTGKDTFETELSFGESTHCVELDVLRYGSATCAFGELTVDLCSCRQVTENCEIEVNCSFGSLELLVPKRFAVELDRSSAFGSIDISGQPDHEPEGTIELDANVSFGQIRIRYI